MSVQYFIDTSRNIEALNYLQWTTMGPVLWVMEELSRAARTRRRNSTMLFE